MRKPRAEFAYQVYTCGNHAKELQRALDIAAGHGGRVINVTWQPHGAGGVQRTEEGYVVVAEFRE